MTLQQKPTWVSTFHTYYEKYAGKLILNFSINSKAAGVYIFLLTQKWFFNEPKFSAYKIYTKLKLILSYIVEFENSKEEKNQNYSEKNIYESLQTLVNKGFVRKSTIRIKKNKGKGRPAKVMYETNEISAVFEFTENQINQIREKKLNVLSNLADIEESLDLRIGKNEHI